MCEHQSAVWVLAEWRTELGEPALSDKLAATLDILCLWYKYKWTFLLNNRVFSNWFKAKFSSLLSKLLIATS
jgi:hypothetical protein